MFIKRHVPDTVLGVENSDSKNSQKSLSLGSLTKYMTSETVYVLWRKAKKEVRAKPCGIVRGRES
jgi:hypothetical protein